MLVAANHEQKEEVSGKIDTGAIDCCKISHMHNSRLIHFKILLSLHIQ